MASPTKTAHKLTPAQLGQAYKDYVGACQILWDLAPRLRQAGFNYQELRPFGRVSDYLAKVREEYWRMLWALPILQYCEAFDNSITPRPLFPPPPLPARNPEATNV